MAAGSTDNIESENQLKKNEDDTFLNILVTGKTGVGKSRLVNALVGKNVTKESACESTPYETTIQDVAVKVWDSPGLQDGTTNEDKYIQDMKDNIKDIALMIYCVRMDDARFYEADKKAIETLTDEFGKEVWNHAVVALTFANNVKDPDDEDELGYFQSQFEEWKKQFKEYFASIGIDPEVCIPVIPAGSSKKMSLPDRQNWLSDLRTECYQVMKASATLRPYINDSQRLVDVHESKSTLDVRTYDRHQQGSQVQWSQLPWTVISYVWNKLREYNQYLED